MNISVVMVTYNRRELFPVMTESILSQDYSDFEFVIINNGSTDDTGEAVLQYAHKDSRVKVITLKDRVSVGAARNCGVKNAHGDYITFVDDDDHVTLDYLSALTGLVNEYHADYVMCGSAELENGIETPQITFDGRLILSGEQGVEELISRKHIRAGMPGKMIRRNLLERYPFREDVIHEDVHTMYKYLADSNKVILDGEIRYYFHRHGSNLSRFTSHYETLTSQQLKEYIEAYEQREEWLSGRFPEKKDYWEYSVWSFMLSMCEKVRENHVSECEMEYDYMARVINKNRKRIEHNRYMDEIDRKRMELV